MLWRRSLLVATIVLMGLAAPIASECGPRGAQAGVFNDLMRHFGVGYSDGYHARSAETNGGPMGDRYGEVIVSEWDERAPSPAPIESAPSKPTIDEKSSAALRIERTGITRRPISPAQLERARQGAARR